MPRRSKDELIESFKEQLNFVKKSSAAYDEGDKSEAKRLATHIDILLHDRGKTLSLLTQLGFLSNTKFFSPAHPYSQGNVLSEARLCMKMLNADGVAYMPILDDAFLGWKQLDFSDWWEEPILILRGSDFQSQNEIGITRKKLIVMMRDKDGGAHIDNLIPKYYSDLGSGKSMGWQYTIGNQEAKFIPYPHFASVRHIAHEVLKSTGHLIAN